MRAGELTVHCNAGDVDTGCRNFACPKRAVSPRVVRDGLIVTDLTEDCAEFVPARTLERVAE